MDSAGLRREQFQRTICHGCALNIRDTAPARERACARFITQSPTLHSQQRAGHPLPFEEVFTVISSLCCHFQITKAMNASLEMRSFLLQDDTQTERSEESRCALSDGQRTVSPRRARDPSAFG